MARIAACTPDPDRAPDRGDRWSCGDWPTAGKCAGAACASGAVSAVIAVAAGLADRRSTQPCRFREVVRNRPLHCVRGWTGFRRTGEHTSELNSIMRLSYSVVCLTKTTYMLQHAQD